MKMKLSIHIASLVLSSVFLPVLTPEAAAQALSRGPYLQMGSTTEITVRWRTSSSTDSVVRYGTTPGNLNLSATDSSPVINHVVRLTALAPNSQYYYSIGSISTTLASGSDYFFITSPSGAKSTRIWVIGDAGTKGSSQMAVRNAYYNFMGTRHTDLWMMLGDNAYDSGTDTEYQAAVFSMYPTLLRKSVVWPTLGNHDGYTGSPSSHPYYDIFTLPMMGEAGGVSSGTEAYYSFNYGNIHFICLNSFDVDRSTGGAMLNWLQADLANLTQDWIVAFWHHPPYSKGSHNSDTEVELYQMRQNALPILEAGGVDLVLCGHSHSYERSKFIDGHYGTSGTLDPSMIIDGGSGRADGAYTKPVGPVAHEGAVYAVAGSSGQISGGSLNHPVMYISLNLLGSMVLDFNNNQLDAQFLDSTGVRRDWFTIVKEGVPGNAAPTVSITSPANGATFTTPVNITINATASDSDGTVTKVDFYAGATFIGTAPTSPYSVVWNNAPVGTHSLTAVATDDDNATRTSSPVSITVNSPIFSFQDGVNGYAGTRDTFIKSKEANKNNGNSERLEIDGNPDLAALIKWDLTSIPVGKQVTAVTLTFEVDNTSPIAYEFYALQRDWTESTATWNQANTGVNWQVPGANGALDRGTSVLGSISASSKGPKTLILNTEGVAQVQSWVNAPASNYGFILLDLANTDDLKLYSSEKSTVSKRPKITVNYQ